MRTGLVSTVNKAIRAAEKEGKYLYIIKPDRTKARVFYARKQGSGVRLDLAYSYLDIMNLSEACDAFRQPEFKGLPSCGFQIFTE